MHRTRWVCRHELEVDTPAGQGGVVAVPRPLLDDQPGHVTLRGIVKSHVEKARPGDVDCGDARRLPQSDGDGLGDLARRPTRPLRQLECNVGGVVTVRPVLRPVDRRRWRRLDDQLAGRDGSRDRSQHGVRNLRGGHSREVIAASPCARPR